MAKSKSSSKKKGAKAPAPHLSPADFLRLKARSLPIGKCYLGKDGEAEGLYTAVVTRIRPSGNVAACFYVVETYCFGVTDSYCMVNLTPEEWKERLDLLIPRSNLREVPYEMVHNMIYGAIEFAEEAQLEPCSTFDITEYMLEEDSDDIPMVDVEMGREGKHYINVRNLTADSMEVVESLKNLLGDDFEYEVSDSDAPFKYRIKTPKEKSFRSEPFSYDYPAYPSELQVKHPEIADAFLSPENLYRLPPEVKERIMSLPPDEVAADIAAIILYVIGATYRDIMENPDEGIPHGALIHSLIFLTAIESDAAFDALVELIHQSDDFIEAHLGDFANDLLPQALAKAIANNPTRIVPLLDCPGVNSFNRFYALKSLAQLYYAGSVYSDEILEIFRTHLRRIATDLPATHACDAEYAGLMVCLFPDIKVVDRLEPEIKALFDTGEVNTSICGTFEEILSENDSDGVVELSDCFNSIDDHYASLERARLISEGLL